MPKTVEVELLPHQRLFLADTSTKFLALVAGFGAGKTVALAHKAIQLAYLNKGATGILLEPSYPLLHDILIPALEAELDRMGIPYEKRVTPNVNFYLYFDANNPTTLLLRSFENWQRLIGVNAAFVGVDEIDTVRKDIAKLAWNKLQGRLRAGRVRQMFTTSTPEGFGFLYEWFYKEQGRPDRRLIQARTTDNPYLPADFIDSLYANYPENLIEAYINGKFVNLQSGTVYRMFDRLEHHQSITLEKGEKIHIGMDFNIERMAAVAAVIRDGKMLVFDEFVDIYDTFEMAKAIKSRYWMYNRDITIYPDASSRQRHSSASQTDLTILRKEGFSISLDGRNPTVKDRIMSVNAAFRSMRGDTVLYIDTDRCPNLTEALEQLAYRNGEPDKSSGYDHITDALGYFVHKHFKAQRPPVQEIKRDIDDRYHRALEAEALGDYAIVV